MDNDPAFAVLLRDAAERAIAYRATLDGRPQRPEQDFVAARDSWAAPVPEQGAPAGAVIAELDALARPGLHAMTGARFFGWVIGASHPVGVAADWLTSAWGQNAGNHLASPASAAAEAVAERWLLDVLRLPDTCSVGFVTGATMANVVGLAAARGAVLRPLGWHVEAQGLFGAPPIRVLLGEEAHATVLMALQFLGLGHDRVERVATDAQGAMRPDALRDALARGGGPCIVAIQAGQLNTGAFDPAAALIALARDAGAWVHVDGAFGLWARTSARHAHMADGFDGADSWATDGHKWLQTPYDCGFAIVRDGDAHRRAMALVASYLPTVAAGERDPSHYVPELSRRARGFATWAMLRHLGREGIARMVERHCRLARLVAAEMDAEPGIAVLNDVVLNQVILRFGDDDAATRRTIARLQADGVCFAGGAQWKGRWVMRISVSGWPTTEADAQRSAEAIRTA
ncbi:MAG TPA: aminotransferase class V-fold PLP-dependent enzyme, partial [Acetobacteraceae bacterium]|nr:aminotransferase class V-fold PLP-dependent enzyme [Acetobacteraceae bacterium]